MTETSPIVQCTATQISDFHPHQKLSPRHKLAKAKNLAIIEGLNVKLMEQIAEVTENPTESRIQSLYQTQQIIDNLRIDIRKIFKWGPLTESENNFVTAFKHLEDTFKVKTISLHLESLLNPMSESFLHADSVADVKKVNTAPSDETIAKAKELLKNNKSEEILIEENQHVLACCWNLVEFQDLVRLGSFPQTYFYFPRKLLRKNSPLYCSEMGNLRQYKHEIPLNIPTAGLETKDFEFERVHFMRYLQNSDEKELLEASKNSWAKFFYFLALADLLGLDECKKKLVAIYNEGKAQGSLNDWKNYEFLTGFLEKTQVSFKDKFKTELIQEAQAAMEKFFEGDVFDHRKANPMRSLCKIFDEPQFNSKGLVKIILQGVGALEWIAPLTLIERYPSLICKVEGKDKQTLTLALDNTNAKVLLKGLSSPDSTQYLAITDFNESFEIWSAIEKFELKEAQTPFKKGFFLKLREYYVQDYRDDQHITVDHYRGVWNLARSTNDENLKKYAIKMAHDVIEQNSENIKYSTDKELPHFFNGINDRDEAPSITLGRKKSVEATKFLDALKVLHPEDWNKFLETSSLYDKCLELSKFEPCEKRILWDALTESTMGYEHQLKEYYNNFWNLSVQLENTLLQKLALKLAKQNDAAIFLEAINKEFSIEWNQEEVVKIMKKEIESPIDEHTTDANPEGCQFQ